MAQQLHCGECRALTRRLDGTWTPFKVEQGNGTKKQETNSNDMPNKPQERTKKENKDIIHSERGAYTRQVAHQRSNDEWFGYY